MNNVKTYHGKTKSLQLDEIELKKRGSAYTFEGYASKPVIDRYSEIVDVKAFEGTLEQFAKNSVMLHQHNPREAIGTFPKLDLKSDGLWVGGVIGHGWPLADQVRAQVEQKILRTMSIGFRETQRGVVDKDGIYHITGLELLEISIVSIPANQDALFTYDEYNKTFLSIDTFDPPDGVHWTPPMLQQLRHIQAGVRSLQLRAAARAAERVARATRERQRDQIEQLAEDVALLVDREMRAVRSPR